jgi:hypothetical protein
MSHETHKWRRKDYIETEFETVWQMVAERYLFILSHSKRVKYLRGKNTVLSAHSKNYVHNVKKYRCGMAFIVSKGTSKIVPVPN